MADPVARIKQLEDAIRKAMQQIATVRTVQRPGVSLVEIEKELGSALRHAEPGS